MPRDGCRKLSLSLVFAAHLALGIGLEADDSAVGAADAGGVGAAVDAGANNPADLENRLARIRKAGERAAAKSHATKPDRPADGAKIVAAVMKNGIHLRGHDFAGSCREAMPAACPYRPI